MLTPNENYPVFDQSSGGGGNLPRPQTQADFDSLEPDQEYIDPGDGKTYKKPKAK
jgi:hypothetical protein